MRPITDQEFWNKMHLVETTGCWEWGCYRDRKKYGLLTKNQGSPRLAHRVAWTLINGSIPAGLCVLHRCDNPPCCNPDHLFLGTRADNNHDMWKKWRGFSKMTPDSIRELRDFYLRGCCTLKTLGQMFYLSESVVSKIVRRKIWKQVS